MPSGDKFDAANLSEREIEADAVFRAIGDIKRRKIMEMVSKQPGIRVTEVCNYFPLSRFAILKHLNILEEAGLIVRSKQGTTKKLTLRINHLQSVLRPWLAELITQKPSTADDSTS